MASLSHTLYAPRAETASTSPSLWVELAVAAIRPRLEAALRRLEQRDDLPAALRRPNLASKAGRRPGLDLSALALSFQHYRETKAALSARGDQTLADIAVNREDIPDIAWAASFGWLLASDLNRAPGHLARLKARLHDLRVALAPTPDERDERYLAGSHDIHELEYRIRELERRRIAPRPPAGAWGARTR